VNFLLKIVEGPNRGAEIALVEGVAVTLGKGDGCDIVLADTTLPDVPVSIEASADAVSIDGEPVDQFAVKTLGATSFAVGPADVPWGELKWPAKEKDVAQSRGESENAESQHGKDEPSRGSAEAQGAEEENHSDSASPREEKKRHGCLGCLVAFALLVLALAVLAWLFRAAVRPYAEKALAYVRESLHGGSGGGETRGAAGSMSLSAVASRYGLELEESDGAAKLSGNLKTRAERLRATAEAYEARPGVDLDLSDDESFKAAADDAVFTITEGAMKVVAATNRVLAIGGVSRSPEELRRALEALGADLPRLRNVDTSGVRFGIVRRSDAAGEVREDAPVGVMGVSRRAAKKSSDVSLPVCGILTKPYPCLVMRDGTRVLEGAALGESVILKIEADAVTVTNSTGRFTWKP
jgi:hypothetical protein